MLIAGIVLGLVLGLLAGGSILNLASVRLRMVGLLVAAVAVRFAIDLLMGAGIAAFDVLRLPLYALAFGALLYALWSNRTYPGMSLAFVGVAANALVILVNGGFMAVWQPSLEAAGFTTADVSAHLYVILPPPLDAQFLFHLGPLADVIPVQYPIVQNVISVGDLFISAGLAFFLFASVVRLPKELEPEEAALVDRRLDDYVGATRHVIGDGLANGDTGLSPALTATVALDRPLILGGAAPGMAAPSSAVIEAVAPPAPVAPIAPAPPSAVPAEASAASAVAAPAVAATAVAAVPAATAPVVAEVPAEPLSVRVAHHPYVRLALNGPFSALWTGQLISMFGDRLNQLALVAVVLALTGSALASGLAFFAATLPNLLLGPIAGTFVDRWDHKETMVVSDILRAALVLLVPIAAAINILLVYPLIFAVTSVSVFFRPARVAILPRIVPESDLLSANSALWVGETLADVIGYPLMAIAVTALGSAVALAFWVDAATYLASAALISAMAVARQERSTDVLATPDFRAELAEGWQFLRQESVLLANTLQGVFGQFGLGIAIALTPAFVRATYSGSGFGFLTAYGFLETALGLGNLIGGFAIGLIGARFAKGRMVIVGYTLFGFFLLLFALTNNLGLAIGFILAHGIANMIFVIPSQTLMQERTPPELMGRVAGLRFAMVFGSMTIALGLGSILGQLLGPGVVIAVFAIVTMLTGLAGLFVPAVRDA